MKIIPVILCGGKGSRLWPLSRQSYPKQFLKLCGDSDKSLLQQTQERILNIENLDAPIIICNEEHRFLVGEQLRDIGITPKAIILEPIGRNTAAAVAIGAIKALETSDEILILVLSADHKINNPSKFKEVVEKGLNYAKKGNLITFGVIPTHPETDYGYIESEEEFKKDIIKASKIKQFIEKPNKKLAEQLIRDKKFTWNSGIFLFKAKSIIDELEKYSPSILKHCRDSLKKSNKDLDFIRINSTEFKKSPDLPIDIAVMEKTNLGIVFPLDAGWSDIGSWKSLWENENKDIDGNFIKGKVINIDSKNCYIKSEQRLLVTLGLKDLIVVETSDAMLISNKENTKSLKSIVNKIKELGYQEGIEHKKIYRPWGNYYSLVEGLNWKVKQIEVKPKGKLSLQMHHHRAEHWVVVRGIAEVQINNDLFKKEENESIYIPLGSKHRLYNPGEETLILIEVQSGTYLGEDDIIRFDDVYGR